MDGSWIVNRWMDRRIDRWMDDGWTNGWLRWRYAENLSRNFIP